MHEGSWDKTILCFKGRPIFDRFGRRPDHVIHSPSPTMRRIVITELNRL